MLTDQSIKEFCEEVASSSPAPGGGSVAALSGALGAALAGMVCNLTIGKKRYADVETEMTDIREQADGLRQKCIRLIDADAEAFNGVIKAMGLPKDTDEQKTVRGQAMQSATKDAARTPMEVIRLALLGIQLAGAVAVRGNQNSVSDAGVSALMLRAAGDAAALNVRINLASLGDEEFILRTREEMDTLLFQIHDQELRILEIVENKIK